MLKLLVLSILFMSELALAVDVKVSSLCDKDLSYSLSFELEEGRSVLDYTVETMDFHNLDYVAYENGISQVFESPTGMDALEVLSDRDMRSYGWCYLTSSVEGLPSIMPNELIVNDQAETIHWFYGYAAMKNGQWISYCVPVYEQKPDFICSP